ncbi:MAG: orotidine-5'-phosphate decarboxylase [Phycisphaeraceae bacterium]|nr:orotidine-5'-phosphate decarboxylase [Phycisphaeraceae bacterium]
MDRLLEAAAKKSAPVCVGIDPVLEKIPQSLREVNRPVEAMETFCATVLEAVQPHAPCVKFQSACFERYFAEGLAALRRLMRRASELGLLVILDAKRGDIGTSAAHYAAGCLADSDDGPGPDALTVNGYFGSDGLDPFLAVCREQGKGLFALVRTSNPGGDAIQSQKLTDGRTVAETMGAVVADLGGEKMLLGERGFSCLGAVVGATKAEDAERLRQIMPQQLFLVPGFGAQGGTADDVRPCFRADGTGALITASRSITYAFGNEEGWAEAVAEAAARMNRQIAAIV